MGAALVVDTSVVIADDARVPVPEMTSMVQQREPLAESAARYVHVRACVCVHASQPARASLLFSLHALAFMVCHGRWTETRVACACPCSVEHTHTHDCEL